MNGAWNPIARAIVYAAVVLCCTSMVRSVEFAGGTGEPNDPYQIATAEQLVEMGKTSDLHDGHYVLAADIDLDPNLPGGQVFEEAIIPWLSGVFDGRGHAIRNLTIHAPLWSKGVGLFRSISGEARIRNVRLENARISAGEDVGAIVGAGWGGRIEACSVDGDIRGGIYVGGLAGRGVEISHCRSAARVTGQGPVGGLIGSTYSRVTYSYSLSDVRGQRQVGGLAGYSRGWIESCYFAGRVAGGYPAGGLVGSNPGDLVTCYAAGRVEGTRETGPLTGDGGWIYLCFWDTDVMGPMTAQGTFRRTTSQMRNEKTFRGWGHDGAWNIREGEDYPRLVWEQSPGQLLTYAQRPYAGGTGTADDPYRIQTPEQFAAIAYHRDDFDKHFRLMADLNLTPVSSQLIPIGTAGLPFRGMFDGGGMTLSGFRYDGDGQDGIGVFGCVGRYEDETVAVVRNVRLVDCNLLGNAGEAGTLAGRNWGRIESCSVHGQVAGVDMIGGLVGLNYGEIVRCRSQIAVTASFQVGGVVGMNQGRLRACSSEGHVQGDIDVGGLIGNSNCGGAIVACHSSAGVDGVENVGGLVGSNICSATVVASYACGPVAGDADVGGLVGSSDGLAFLSYWCTHSTGQAKSAGGVGKTTEEMKQARTFRGWGYEGEWTIREGQDFPRLIWEQPDGNPLIDEPRSYGGGTGTPDDPYRIQTAEQLATLGYYRADFDKHFVLMNDVDMEGMGSDQIQPIGVPGFPFTGVFDGNSHTVSRCRLHKAADPYVGLFGYVRGDPCSPVGDHAAILDLCLAQCEFSGPRYVGGIIGFNEGAVIGCRADGVVVVGELCAGAVAGHNAGDIEACVATGHVETLDRFLGVSGGLVGVNRDVVENSHATCDVIGKASSGGLVGENANLIVSSSSHGNAQGDQSAGGLAGYSHGRIEACWSDARATGTWAVGGLVGRDEGRVLACYAQGSVAGDRMVGGLIGSASKQSDMAYCYSTGAVRGQQSIGGLVGYKDSQASIHLCYWDTDTSGIKSLGEGPAPGRTTTQMHQAPTFVGWDFENTWMICEGRDYPRLLWQGVVCDK